eukprot:4353262-Alexandrium_andersonii.AAC.1
MNAAHVCRTKHCDPSPPQPPRSNAPDTHPPGETSNRPMVYRENERRSSHTDTPTHTHSQAPTHPRTAADP